LGGCSPSSCTTTWVNASCKVCPDLNCAIIIVAGSQTTTGGYYCNTVACFPFHAQCTAAIPCTTTIDPAIYCAAGQVLCSQATCP
jgi:hypothetical protein